MLNLDLVAQQHPNCNCPHDILQNQALTKSNKRPHDECEPRSYGASSGETAVIWAFVRAAGEKLNLQKCKVVRRVGRTLDQCKRGTSSKHSEWAICFEEGHRRPARISRIIPD